MYELITIKTTATVIFINHCENKSYMQWIRGT